MLTGATDGAPLSDDLQNRMGSLFTRNKKVSLGTVLKFSKELAPDVTKSEATALSDADLIGRLEALGVSSDGVVAPSRESLETSFLLVSQPDFWRQHHDLHPNRSRVKNWLWVHERYRNMR